MRAAEALSHEHGGRGTRLSSCQAVQVRDKTTSRVKTALVIAATVKMADRSSGWLKKASSRWPWRRRLELTDISGEAEGGSW